MPNRRFDRAAKRAFDVALSASGLLVLAPVLAASALAVKLSSPGPVLFRQERVGLGGVPFDILKFRTMRSAGSGEQRQITVGRDPRITGAGHVLRKWKLDELPQLWNVLVGEMSLVGPRPEVPVYVALYPPEERDLVLSVRPGITDPCSIHLRDESELLASADDPERYYRETLIPMKLRSAIEYTKRRTVWLDVAVIIQTVLSVFRK